MNNFSHWGALSPDPSPVPKSIKINNLQLDKTLRCNNHAGKNGSVVFSALILLSYGPKTNKSKFPNASNYLKLSHVVRCLVENF